MVLFLLFPDWHIKHKLNEIGYYFDADLTLSTRYL